MAHPPSPGRVPGEARRIIHVVPYVTRPLRVLLLLRPAHDGPGWQGVTGKVEAWDTGTHCAHLLGEPATPEVPTLARACLREIAEETGLPPPRHVEDLGLERVFTGYDGKAYSQRTFLARYDDTHPVTRTPEHLDARWVEHDEALALARWESDATAIKTLRERHGE